MTVRFLHGAAADLDEGFLFYEKKEPGVGQQFILEVKNAIECIQQDPNLGRVLLKVRSVAEYTGFPTMSFSGNRPTSY